ncbi:hypothetical protein RvY_07006-2 [Ramazzottius varieornatus]|uniref:Uncharacterized protein n=1 Tax=Ramazzottius varieornatus TaxID=947166 RepID=A0A1D1V0K4_RAMVA|nr:hypothetical protein RvY_07006-2 [Ramazzottius varieornatus]
MNRSKKMSPKSTTGEETNEESVEEPNDNSRLSEKRKKPSSPQKSRRKKKRKAISDRSFLIEENKEIDRALADYLFSANLPLSTVENPFFVQFCKKLKPTYDLPSRHRIVSQNFIQGAQPFQMNYFNPGLALNLPVQTTPNHQPSSSSTETPSGSSSFLATPPQFHGTI